MSFDLYASIPCDTKQAAEEIVRDANADVQARIRLLAPALRTPFKDNARRDYQELVYPKDAAQTRFARDLIARQQARMTTLGLWQPAPPDFSLLPPRSAFLQFTFTLARPYLSRDDEAFHINDNPVRKDKVFKVPMVAGTTWKGNLRWTAMKVDLQPVCNNPHEMAQRRLRHALLFGTEKGFETADGWTAFLNHRCPADPTHYTDCHDAKEHAACRETREAYAAVLHERFGVETDEALPHHAGRLRFFPTFFDRIGLEVINPHDRATRAGKQPLFFESAPVGATGVFSLLYVPFDDVEATQAAADLQLTVNALTQMMRVYGFSAKKTSGFGEAGPDIDGNLWTAAGIKSFTDWPSLAQEVANVGRL